MPDCSLGLFDYIGDSILRRDEHDLVFGDEKFERLDLRNLLGHQRRKLMQLDVGGYFLANFCRNILGRLKSAHVLHVLFNNVLLLGGEMNRSLQNRPPVVWRRLRNGADAG